MITRNAFSLVELSIVLVILGLLVGGILAGQSLIKSAEMRKTIAEFDRYKTATNAFRDKYFGLPGDITNATSFWGAADGNDGLGTDCYMVTGNATCNGNGDGQIVGNSGTNVYPEEYRYWQQLTLAGLLDGSFSGVPGAATAPYNIDVIGTNMPRSALSDKLGYAIAAYWSSYAYSSTSMPRQNAITISSYLGGNTALDGPFVPCVTAWQLDTKIDDGAPGSGQDQVYAGWGGTLSASAYNTASTSTLCQPVIGMGF